MVEDQTFTISQIYGDAFNANAIGNIEEINEETFPYERFVEFQIAMELMTEQGKDPEEVYELFDIKLQDALKIGEFWGGKIIGYSELLSTFDTVHPDDDFEAAEIERLNEEYARNESFRKWAQDTPALEAKFKEKYSVADSTDDISF